MKLPAKLPIGIDNFEEIRTEDFYYVDKTGMIKELLHSWGKVNLFTRPRRFGKSLNISMLKNFFEPGCNHAIFEGLAIWEEKDLCHKYMGKFPVISLSLKGVDGEDFETAKSMLRTQIGMEALRFRFLLDSNKLPDEEKELYRQIIHVDEDGQDIFSMSDSILTSSLLILSHLLQKYYSQKVIILIDEYDVPLDKAYQSGYYDDMVKFIRGMFIHALKNNDYMLFAVLTGCLRISKESIFTDLNNPKISSITSVLYNEYFGFTDQEVREMLSYYDLTNSYNIMKEWYDGYRFGNQEVYCPWDVINYCDDLRSDPSTCPQNYWINTSSNNIIKKFIQKSTSFTKKEIEELIAGGFVKKVVRQNITYTDLETSIENLWSMLFMTGYLTQLGAPNENIPYGDMFSLTIPNKEIKQIFIEQIKEWFDEETHNDSERLNAFYTAIKKGDTTTIQEHFNAYLRKTISIRDTTARKEKKENFYHGLLLGLLSHKEDWIVSSNAESGEGYSDILIEIPNENIGVVIEIKYAEKGKFENSCHNALKQIEDNNYYEVLIDDGMQTIYKYGIACYKKRCMVFSASDEPPILSL